MTDTLDPSSDRTSGFARAGFTKMIKASKYGKAVLKLIDIIIPIGFAGALCWFAPLRTAFQFGADEGYELMKGLLCSHGYSLYREVWNDQPPLQTWLLSGLFRIFGPSALVGRLLTVAFATVLVAALYAILRKQAGRFGAAVAALLLISSPPFIQLSVSTMIELPAVALAVAALAAWSRYLETGRLGWVILSSILMGCALQIKFTAGIFVAAFLAEAMVGWAVRGRKAGIPIESSGRDHKAGRRGPNGWTPSGGASGAVAVDSSTCREMGDGIDLRALVLWTVVMGASFTVIALISGEDFGVFWRSHFSAGTAAAVAEGNSYKFRSSDLLDWPEALLPALAGIVFVIWRRRWDLLFPVVLLGTVFLTHVVHRPYWYYYQIHFAIPLVWLAGIGIADLFASIWSCDWADFKRPPFKAAWGLLVWSALVSLVIVEGAGKLKNGFDGVSFAEPAAENTIVQWMRSHRKGSPWVFTDRVIYAFHAQLLVPPELAVTPTKRRWSGQLASEDVIRILARYRPREVVLFAVSNWGTPVKEFLHEHYILDGTEGTDSPELYTLKSEEIRARHF